jgi:hypothetical protein
MHAGFFLAAHEPAVGRVDVVVSEEVEEAMDEIEEELAARIEAAMLGIFDGDAGTDKDLAEDAVFRSVFCIIDGKGDAIGGSGILKELVVEGCDLFFGDEVDGDPAAFDAFARSEKRYRFFDRASRDLEVFLGICK